MALSNQPTAQGRETSDVEKRIIVAIKIYDEGMNRYMIGEHRSFKDFTDTLRFHSSSLLIWICIMELQKQVDHLSHAHLVSEWVHQMIVKYFVYESIPKEKWNDVKLLMTEWYKFQNRTNPRVYKAVKEAFKSLPDWNLPYRDKLQKIWNIDPDKAANVWKEVWGE